jgi:hypothetical protein
MFNLKISSLWGKEKEIKMKLILLLTLLSLQSVMAASIDFDKEITVCVQSAPRGNESVEFVKFVNEIGSNRKYVQFNDNANNSVFSAKEVFLDVEGQLIVKYSSARVGQKEADKKFQETLILNKVADSGVVTADKDGRVLMLYPYCKSFASKSDEQAMLKWVKKLK